LIVEGRNRTKESPFESGVGPSPEAGRAKEHIVHPRAFAVVINTEHKCSRLLNRRQLMVVDACELAR